jgi:hypothetical protein
LLRSVQRALQGDDLRAVDAADAREAVDRLLLAPPVGGLRPFTCPPVVGRVATGGDHAAVRHARHERVQFAVHRGDGGLLQEGESLVGASSADQEPSLLKQSPSADVGVGESRTDLYCLSGELDGRLDVTGVLRRKALRQGPVSVGKTFRFTLQEALATGRPCRGDRELPLADVFAAELEGDLGSPGSVPIRNVRLERTLPCFHCQIGLGGEPGRLGKRLEV